MDPKDKNPPPDPEAPSEDKKRTAEVAGVAVAGAAGGAIGAAVAGPIGGVVGIAAGAIAGGLAGRAAISVNPTVEDAYWRDNWSKRPYADPKHGYEHYRPAYRHGWESRMMHGDRSWEDVEPDLEKSWAERRGHSALDWTQARVATKDAWDRLEGSPGTGPDRKDH